MIKTLSTETKTITPEYADDLLQKHNIFKDQRPIAYSYVRQLTRKIELGLYTGANVVMGILDDTLYICDGQHSLTAIAFSGTSQDVTIKRIQCDTERDLATLYQQYDGGRTRSIRDHARVEAGFLDINWPAKVVSNVIGGANIITFGLWTPKDITKDERVRLLRDFIDEGDFVYRLISDKTAPRILLRQHVVAVIMQSYRKNNNDAELFWTKVKDGEMLTKTDPAYHLREFLQTNSTRGSDSKTASRREFYVKCVKAWNVFRCGKEMRILRYNADEKIPTVK